MGQATRPLTRSNRFYDPLKLRTLANKIPTSQRTQQWLSEDPQDTTIIWEGNKRRIAINNAIIAIDLGIIEEIATNRIRKKQESLKIPIRQTNCSRTSTRTTIMEHLPGVQKEHIKS